MNAAHIVRQIVIRGRVQRVGYRAWAEHGAPAWPRGLVRNRADGMIERSSPARRAWSKA
jgi:acylphosphatase